MTRFELLNEYYKLRNIAEKRDDTELQRIGDNCNQQYEEDLADREDWEKANEKAIKLASQYSSGASWAGQDSFDVMYPIISTAAIQFAARAYPNIIKGADVVKCSKPGIKIDGVDDRALRMTKFLNFQLLNQIPDWPESMDELLFILPVMGCHFKKTYQTPIGVVSESVPAVDLILQYKAKSLTSAPQVTQRILLSQNDVIERIRTGLYRDIPIKDLGFTEDEKDEQLFLEHHCLIDLDEDDYKEPYTVVVHKETGRVMRITARFNLDGIKSTKKGEIYRIEPVNHYTRYMFMPAFDGCVYGMGFGRLLGPINTSVNAVINQLLDSGSLYTRQGGFLGQDLRIGRNQSMYFQVGEWKHVSYRGDDLRKNIVPLPAHEPSMVLFQLLGTLVNASKEMSSTSELLSGEQRQSNVPASTTLALIEQGLKVFSGIYKRIFRSLKTEIAKIRELDYLYLEPEEYANVLNVDPAIANPEEDFFIDDYDIIPLVDETEITEVQKVAKAEALMGLKGQGYNDEEIDRRYLEAISIENIEAIIPTEKQPNPQAEAEMELTKAKAERERSEAALAMEKVNTEVVEQSATQGGLQLDSEKLVLEQARTAHDIQMANLDAATAKTDTPKADTKKAKRKLEETTPTSKQRDQKRPYREVGMKSDNVRRREQAK